MSERDEATLLKMFPISQKKKPLLLENYSTGTHSSKFCGLDSVLRHGSFLGANMSNSFACNLY